MANTSCILRQRPKAGKSIICIAAPASRSSIAPYLWIHRPATPTVYTGYSVANIRVEANRTTHYSSYIRCEGTQVASRKRGEFTSRRSIPRLNQAKAQNVRPAKALNRQSGKLQTRAAILRWLYIGEDENSKPPSIPHRYRREDQWHNILAASVRDSQEHRIQLRNTSWESYRSTTGMLNRPPQGR